MKNVSLYIAKRYNAHTLLISMLLIVISSFLIGAFIYIGENFYVEFKSILYNRVSITSGQQFVLSLITGFYILAQIGIVWFIFNKLLGNVNQKRKNIIAFVLSLVCFLLGIVCVLLGFKNSIYLNFIPSILFSTSLLSFTYGLFSLIFSKRKITGVNIITSIAVFAITIATSALFIILSVFSGLEKMNIQFFSNVNPDLKISPAQGKEISNIEEVISKLNSNSDVVYFSKVIEEKVSIEYGDKQDIAYIKGIDENYTQVVRIDTTILAGSFFDFDSDYQILASDGVARRLQMYVDGRNYARLMMPKAGTGLISSEDEAFRSAFVSANGVLFINEQYDKYIFSPIGLTQELLGLPSKSAYSIEIKLQPNSNLNLVKKNLQSELGDTVVVQTRQDLDATFLKVMNVENIIIYLIFTLVIVIASFNLAGAIIIIIIDKKEQIQSMWSFGLPRNEIKQIFFNTGLLITIFSIIFGLTLASIIGVLQNKYSLVMANQFVAFPFEFTLQNYILVMVTVLFIGGSVSYLVSRRLPQ